MVCFSLLCERTSPRYVPSLIQNVCPQITHERIEGSTCPRQRLGIPHLPSISFPPCVRLLMWEVQRYLVSHESGRVEKACSCNPSAGCGECRGGTEYSHLAAAGRQSLFSHGCSLQTVLEKHGSLDIGHFFDFGPPFW